MYWEKRYCRHREKYCDGMGGNLEFHDTGGIADHNQNAFQGK